MKSKPTAGGCPGLGQAGEGYTLQLKVITLDDLCHLSVVKLHFLGQHVLQSRISVDIVVKSFVLDGRVARLIVRQGLVLRFKGLHAIIGQPVHIKHQLQCI